MTRSGRKLKKYSFREYKILLLLSVIQYKLNWSKLTDVHNSHCHILLVKINFMRWELIEHNLTTLSVYINKPCSSIWKNRALVCIIAYCTESIHCTSHLCVMFRKQLTVVQNGKEMFHIIDREIFPLPSWL